MHAVSRRRSQREVPREAQTEGKVPLEVSRIANPKMALKGARQTHSCICQKSFEWRMIHLKVCAREQYCDDDKKVSGYIKRCQNVEKTARYHKRIGDTLGTTQKQ